MTFQSTSGPVSSKWKTWNRSENFFTPSTHITCYPAVYTVSTTIDKPSMTFQSTSGLHNANRYDPLIKFEPDMLFTFANDVGVSKFYNWKVVCERFAVKCVWLLFMKKNAATKNRALWNRSYKSSKPVQVGRSRTKHSFRTSWRRETDRSPSCLGAEPDSEQLTEGSVW